MLVSDAETRVYRVPEPPLVRGGRPQPGSILGCALGSRVVHRLGPAPFGTGSVAGGVFRVVLARSIVAYELSCETFAAGIERACAAVTGRRGSAIHLVVVYDLRRGRVLHRLPTGMPAFPSPQKVGSGPLRKIVLKDDGAVAWIADTERFRGTYQVHEADATGVRTLAIGTDIDPRSLALVGGTVSWMQAGMRVSAPLH